MREESVGESNQGPISLKNACNNSKINVIYLLLFGNSASNSINIFETYQLDVPGQRSPGKDTELGKALDTVFDEINETILATLNSISISTMLALKNKLAEAAVETNLDITK